MPERRRRKRHRRRLLRWLVLASLTGASAAVTLWAGGSIGNLDGPLYDLTLTVAAPFARVTPDKVPITIVALDRRSLRSPELARVPRVLMAPQWAQLIDGIAAAGPRAIGFDMIFGFAASRFKSGFDEPFLRALARHRRLVVLGRSMHTPVAKPYFFALGANSNPDAIGYVEMIADSDGVFRTARTTLPVNGGGVVPTLAGALAHHAKLPVVSSVARLAPTRSLEAVPTYALIDVLHCISQDSARVTALFHNRIVLVGTTLPEEDRKLGPDRFFPAPHRTLTHATTPTDSCQLTRLTPSAPRSGTVPGVTLVAASVRALLGQEAAQEASASMRVPTAGLAALAGSGAAFMLAPWMAIATTAALLAAMFAIEMALLVGGTWLPMAIPASCLIAAVSVTYLMRFFWEERRRRRVEHAFGHYLAPALVEQLVENEAALTLGGEVRDVTVMFADLRGFTALSGRVGPERLMELTNRYLSIITEAVDQSGGYVDKFIGDAVMAIWGAPADDPDHAAHAAGAALDIATRVAAARAADRSKGEEGFSVKIGINTGPATVGNVGAPKRYNYTAVGETVNIAARLESVPGDYGCEIVLGPVTAAQAGRRYLLNELDWIRVKGKDDALTVFELVCAKSEAADADHDYVVAYGAGLSHYRAGRFAEAQTVWEQLAKTLSGRSKSPPHAMALRAAYLSDNAPKGKWDGVQARTTK